MKVRLPPTLPSWLWPSVFGVLAAVAVLTAWNPWTRLEPDVANMFLFGAWLAALLCLFLVGLLLPLQSRFRRVQALVYTWGIVLGAAGVTFLANLALFGHDVHLDLTREKLFTPSTQAEAVVRGLTDDVTLTYFYQARDPNGRRIKDLLETLGRHSGYLHVRTVDPDKQPRLASEYGVRTYNEAVLESGGRRVQVLGTDETEIALGILRVLREQVKTVCFVEGHGEFSIDNFEYHTHFETLEDHAHGGAQSSVILTERHGIGRMRRALKSLGLEARKIILATLKAIPEDCAAVVDANPRSTYLPGESELLASYLAQGGAAMFLYDLGFVIEQHLEDLLAKMGVRLEQQVVVDPLDHYSTDPEMVAVPVYEPHPITRKLSLTFFPGARPIRLLEPPAGIAVAPLFRTSKDSYTRPVSPVEARQPHPDAHSDPHGGPPPTAGTGSQVLAVAVEGVWPESPTRQSPFRAILVGDSDFASNSFFPYMANSDLVLSMIRWLMREERAPAIRPHIPVVSMVVLTKRQMQTIFLMVEIILPLTVVLCGAFVWWRRR